MVLIPPGVEILIDECMGDDSTSPAVDLKELLTVMSLNGVTTAAIVPLSPTHLIVVGYRERSDATNDETPKAGKGPGGRLKR